jgi:hypothetical protein
LLEKTAMRKAAKKDTQKAKRKPAARKRQKAAQASRNLSENGGKVSPEEAARIESYDLPSGDPAPTAPDFLEEDRWNRRK